MMSKRTIREIVARRSVVVAAQDTAVRVAVRRMAAENCGSILVEDAGHFVGIFTERDALTRVLAEGLDPDATRLRDVMTRNPISIHPDKPLVHALHMMHQHGFRHVPVIEDGRPVGVVSVRDALGAEISQFEYELNEQEQVAERI